MIDWNGVPQLPAKNRVIAGLRKVITKQNYGFGPGQWNMTGVIQEQDIRKYHIYQIIEGIDAEMKRDTLRGIRMDFRVKVLTRQACCRDKEGHTIWQRQQALENLGMDGDFVPEFNDPPQPGDVVEWKGAAKTEDEYGNPVDSKTIKRWAQRGIRRQEFEEFIVDEDGCISVHYPFILSMLKKHGERIAFPQFRKVDNKSKNKRKITNWQFREVPQDYRAPVKALSTPSKKGKVDAIPTD